VIEDSDAEERPCTLDDARGAEEAFIASSVREVMPIAAIDDATIDGPGPVTREAAERLSSRIARNLTGAAA
jgi:branched-chain amino acid aminotransferase